MAEKKQSEKKEYRSSSLTYAIVFLAVGVLINILGSMAASALNLPLYLDSIGTVLAAVLGGYLPGIIVGFMSNIINSVNNPINGYYASISVLLACAASYLANHGYFEKIWKALFTVFPLALIGGGLGSMLTYGLYGLNMGEGISSSMTQSLLGSGHFSVFAAQLSSDILLDLCDKLITVIIVFLISRMIGPALREKLQFKTWHQRPLTSEEKKQIDLASTKGRSLRSKILVIMGISVIFIALVTTTISYTLYKNTTIDEYRQMGEGAARLVASVVPGDRVDEFIANGESAEGYKTIENQLAQIRTTSDNIMYVYSYQIREDGCYVVFDLDTEDTPGDEPGAKIEFDEAFMPFLDELLAGKRIEPIESNEKFGWLMTMYEPIYDSNGQCKAYACVDISMEEVRTSEFIFLAKVFSLFVGFTILVLAVGLWLADSNLITPINSMAYAASRFAYESEEDREDSVKYFKGLDISTGDEIENLYDSFSMTIAETVHYIAEVQEKSDVITKMQNGLILVLADMVESRDKCTGDHVRKTAAYCRIILEQLRRNGEFKDQITDEFIEDVVNSAPLHDIGKIKVSDVILNKPGKLTDEEFEEMKKHTLAGNEIIQQAMELVSSDTGYLKEAKNLAMYHHEKWNGKGYPTGISGEEIPLSARVMAVADVFDALVSKRSYKKPFTFDQAIGIIEEGAGSHFDPRVAKAFLDVKDQAKEIAESFSMNTGMINLEDLHLADAKRPENKTA